MSMLEIAQLKEITKTIDGKEYKFAKMSVRERAAIEEKLILDKRAKIEANLKSAGVSGVDAYGELAAFDDEPQAMALFYKWFNSAKGQSEIIHNAAEKVAKGSGDAAVNAMPANGMDMIQLAADICGVNLAPVKKDEEETTSPNPTGNPASFGT